MKKIDLYELFPAIAETGEWVSMLARVEDGKLRLVGRWYTALEGEGNRLEHNVDLLLDIEGKPGVKINHLSSTPDILNLAEYLQMH